MITVERFAILLLFGGLGCGLGMLAVIIFQNQAGPHDWAIHSLFGAAVALEAAAVASLAIRR